MLGHLSEADIRRYVAGAPSEDADRHVRLCVCCAQQLAVAAIGAFWWEPSGSLAPLS